MKSLNEIMSFWGTDKRKVDHNYIPFYEEILEDKRNEKLKLLEIGIYRPTQPEQDRPLGEWDGDRFDGDRRLPGASLRSWGEYLKNSQIYGIDVFDFTDVESENVKTFICDQTSREGLGKLMDSIGSEFDVIIDDGAHGMLEHQISLGTLFKHVKSGGYYIIEDLQTCNQYPYIKDGEYSTIDILNSFKTDGEIKSNYMTKEEEIYLKNNIKDFKIDVNHQSGIVLIEKI